MSFVHRLRQEIIYALVALQFLTRIPVPTLVGFERAWLGRSSAYFPVVGLIVGAISAGVLLAAKLAWPMAICAVLAIAAGIAATGAFHEDGLADSADGLGGGQTPEQRLTIMKDSRIGTYGACALLGVLILKAVSLAAMTPTAAALALLAAHAGGRVVPVVASAWLPYAGDSGTAKVPPMMPSQSRLLFAIVTGLLPFLALPGIPAAMALCIGFAASALLLAKAVTSIGGHTGDVLGASEQVFETAVLLVLAGDWG